MTKLRLVAVFRAAGLAVALLPAAVLAQTPAAQPTTPPASAPKPATPPATAPQPGPKDTVVDLSVKDLMPKVAPDETVLTIGTEKITAREFDAFLAALPAQYRSAAQGPGKREIAEQYVKMKLLAQEAKRKKLDEQPVVKQQLAFTAENILAQAAFQDAIKQTTVAEADLRKAYDEKKAGYEQAKAHHILIRFKGSPVPVRDGQKDLTEEEALAKAQELRKRILAGEKLEEVAKTESDDPGSRSQGGDLGPAFGRNSMVAPFEQVAFAAPIGQVSEPVKTPFGYHLIRVDERTARPFEQVRTELEGQMRPEAANKMVEELRKTAAVQFNDTYFPQAGSIVPLTGIPQPGIQGGSPAPAAAPRPATPKPAAPKPAPVK